jgi:hypothetical protein
VGWEEWPSVLADAEHHGNDCWWWRSGNLAICVCNRAVLIGAVAAVAALLVAVLLVRRGADR